MFAFLAALAGCGGPAPLTSGPVSNSGKWTEEQLKQTATEFHNKESNRDVSNERVPLKFVDIDGKAVDLALYHGKSNVVLVVVRGVPRDFGGAFCPGCLAQVNALVANYQEFKKRDAEILLVFPGPADKAKVDDYLAQGYVNKADGASGLPFPLLRDTDLNAVKALGISGDLARPSTYILDKKGNAVFAFVGADGIPGTVDRPSVQSLLTRLEKLNAK